MIEMRQKRKTRNAKRRKESFLEDNYCSFKAALFSKSSCHLMQKFLIKCLEFHTADEFVNGLSDVYLGPETGQ